MRILSIMYCFPPLLYPATMCYLKLYVGAREKGVDMDVVTVEPESFVGPSGDNLIDPSLMQLVPSDFVNLPVRSLESNLFLKAAKQKDFLYRILYRFYEPRKKEWTYPAIKLLNRRNLKDYDAILTCSQPHSNHIVGLHLKRKLNKPWIAYFSDPWVDNPYAVFKSKQIGRYNGELESRVISSADRILFTSEEMMNLVLKKYPQSYKDKCGVLPHSYVPQWYDITPAPSGTSTDKLHLVHTGHFYGPRTPMPLFKALAYLKNVDEDLAHRLTVSMYGGMDDSYQNYLRDNGLHEMVQIHDTVPYLQSLRIIWESDLLLLVDAPLKNLGESVFLPSKLVDYLGSMNPVLGITPTRGTSAKALERTGNLALDMDDVEGITRHLRSFADGKSSIIPDKEKVADYHYDTVADQFLTQIASL